MNKIKKSFSLCLIFSLMFTFLLTGCGKKSDKTAADEKGIAVKNENIQLSNYKNLKADVDITEITDKDVESHIQAKLDSFYGTNKHKYKDLTDKIVKELTDTEYVNVDEYKKGVKKELENNEIESKSSEIKNELFDTIVKNSKLVKVEDSDKTYYKDYMDKFYKQSAKYYAQDFEDFKKDKLEVNSEEEYNKLLDENVDANALRQYIIQTIADEEKLVVTDKEIQSEINTQINTNDDYKTEADVLKNITKKEIKLNLLYLKVLDFIYDNAYVK